MSTTPMKSPARIVAGLSLCLLFTAGVAAAVKARVLVVVATQDHVVTPGPALEFTRLLNARVLTLEGDCGHLAPGCEAQKLNPAVADFLSR